MKRTHIHYIEKKNEKKSNKKIPKIICFKENTYCYEENEKSKKKYIKTS